MSIRNVELLRHVEKFNCVNLFIVSTDTFMYLHMLKDSAPLVGVRPWMQCVPGCSAPRDAVRPWMQCAQGCSAPQHVVRPRIPPQPHGAQDAPLPELAAHSKGSLPSLSLTSTGTPRTRRVFKSRSPIPTSWPGSTFGPHICTHRTCICTNHTSAHTIHSSVQTTHIHTPYMHLHKPHICTNHTFAQTTHFHISYMWKCVQLACLHTRNDCTHSMSAHTACLQKHRVCTHPCLHTHVCTHNMSAHTCLHTRNVCTYMYAHITCLHTHISIHGMSVHISCRHSAHCMSHTYFCKHTATHCMSHTYFCTHMSSHTAYLYTRHIFYQTSTFTNDTSNLV